MRWPPSPRCRSPEVRSRCSIRWEIPRADAPERVPALVETLGGQWAPELDERYAKWRRS